MDRSDYKVLIADDNASSLLATKSYLERQSYRVETAANGFEAVEKVDFDPFAYALVVLDYDMPGMDGGETARKLVEINKDIFIVVFSAVTNITLKANNIEFVRKGTATREEFLAVVDSWCRKFEEMSLVSRRPSNLSENEQIISSYALVGRSESLVEILRLVERYEVARSEASMLIRGESGTGKERIARVIHDHSARKDGPFVGVNMGAISPNLVESDLAG